MFSFVLARQADVGDVRGSSAVASILAQSSSKGQKLHIELRELSGFRLLGRTGELLRSISLRHPLPMHLESLSLSRKP